MAEWRLSQAPDDWIARELSHLPPDRLRAIGGMLAKHSPSTLAVMGGGATTDLLGQFADAIQREASGFADHVRNEAEAEKQAQAWHDKRRQQGGG